MCFPAGYTSSLIIKPKGWSSYSEPQAQSENTKSLWTWGRSEARGVSGPLQCLWNQTRWESAGSILESGWPCQYEILKPLRFHLPGWIKTERIRSNQMDRETAIIADEGFCSNLKSPVPAGCEGQSNPKYCPLGHLSPPRSELHFGRDCQPPCCLLKLDPQLLELDLWWV